MAKRREPKDLKEIFRELDTGTNDRATILTAASLVEYALELVISARLREPRNKDESAKLFQDANSIFDSFYKKIWAAYFLKIVGPDVTRDLDLIRGIRNDAAHDMNPVSFRTPEIKRRCAELKLVAIQAQALHRKELTDPRERFLATATCLIANLFMRSGDENAEIPKAFVGLAPDLDR